MTKSAIYQVTEVVNKLVLPAGDYTLNFEGIGDIVYLVDGVLEDADDVSGTTLNASNLTDDITVSGYITFVSDYDTDRSYNILEFVTDDTTTVFGDVDSIPVAYAVTATTASIALLASTVTVKQKEGAFTVADLGDGEIGIDITNDRLYLKFSETEVIHFAGTVV